MDLHACVVSTGWMDEWSPLDGSTRLCGVYLMDGWSPLDGSTRMCGVWMNGIYWMDLHACVESTG